MAEYYAVNRSDEHLAHYGVKGMHWGVQKAIKKGSTKKYYKSYKKATKKLNRLEKQANNKTKYTRRAITNGAKVAATGGLLLAGMSNPGILAYKAGKAGYNAYRAANTKTAAAKAQKWRDEMAKEFNADAIQAVYEHSTRKHKRH